MLLAPYSQITKDSVNSPDGTLAFHLPTTSLPGFTFQAQPRSAQQPIHRPNVSTPYQKKIPPLMKCASPLKISWPLCMRVSEAVASTRNTYHDTAICHATSGNGYKTKRQDDPIDYKIHEAQDPEDSAGY